MNGFKRNLALVAGFVLLGAVGTAFLQRQALADWLRLRSFEPTARIAELAEHTTMTDYGRKLFYVHHPELNDKLEFSRNCPTDEQTIVLGCYITDQSIYVYDVQDTRLDGIEEVTAAHEMLHAAYDRLSDGDKQEVDSTITSVYEDLRDDRLKKIVEAYRKKDPSVVPNELHSIIGTEVRKLPTQLEQYYARYFKKRLQIVKYSEQYEAIFSAQKARIQSLAEQIKRLEAKLKADRQDIELRQKSFEARSRELSELRASGEIDKYNDAIPGYNRQVSAYRTLVDAYNADIARLNNLVAEHNDLAVEQKALFDAIDSSI